MTIFIDTWGWLTLRDKKENQHLQAKEVYTELRKKRGLAFTTDYVLDETFTLLFRRLPFAQAQESLKFIEVAIQKGYLQLEFITPERFSEAKRLRLKFKDKPKISFTDFTTMVVMNEFKISRILTDDDHFTQVGMGYLKLP